MSIVIVLVSQSCLTLCNLSRLLCPWNSPGSNTGVGCHSLLQEIFLTQGLNPGLLLCRQILYHLSHRGNPWYIKSSQIKDWSVGFFFLSLWMPLLFLISYLRIFQDCMVSSFCFWVRIVDLGKGWHAAHREYEAWKALKLRGGRLVPGVWLLDRKHWLSGK